MITRSYKTLTSRPVFLLAAAFAILMLAAPFVFAETKTFTYAEDRTDEVATFSASDQDGNAIEWGKKGDDEGDFVVTASEDGLSATLTFKDQPNFEKPADANVDNVYKVTVTASGGEIEVEVTVTDVDEPGKVTFSGLGERQPQVARDLVASGPADPDEPVDEITWQWYRSENADGPWEDIAKATSESRAPVAADEGMYLRATVTYNDKHGDGKMVSGVTAIVEEKTVANAAPAFTDQTAAAVDDNAALDNDQNLVVVLRAVDEGKKEVNVGKPVTAKDGDGDVLLYAIVAHTERDDAADASSTDTAETNAHEEYEINSRTGQITTKTARNSDDSGTMGADDPDDNDDLSDADGERIESFMVTATDPSGAVGTTIVRVTINDVNDAPEFDPDAPTTGTVNRDTITVVEGTTDLDADGDDNTNTPTYAADDDDAGDGPTASAASPPNTPAVVALTFDVEGTDAGSFTITSATSALAFDDHTPDYETKKSYSVTVVVEDDETPVAGRDTIEVTVNVTNAEDAGTVSLSAREPQVDKTIVASLDDKDGSRRGESWQWYRNAADGTTDANLAGVSADAAGTCDDPAATAGELCRIDGATSPAYKPVAADEGEGKGLLAARVTYRDACTRDTAADDVNDDGFVIDASDELISCDPDATDADDSAFMLTERDVQEEDPGNAAPKFDPDQDPNTAGDQAAASRSVPENEKNENVGEPVTVDDDDLVKFTLGGPDAASFKLDDPPSGANSVQIKTAMELDYETKSEYVVVVTATDPAGATGELTVNITVTDGADDAVITGVKSFTYPEDRTDEVARFSASDQDGNAIEWGKKGDDEGDFVVTASEDGLSATLTFKDQPNFEKPADANVDNVYKVTVTASGGEIEVEVTVTDVDEPGKVTFSGLGERQPQVARDLVASGPADPDEPVDEITWQWYRSENADGPWEDIAKATSESRAPVAADEGMYLRATVTYNDKHGDGKMVSGVTASVEERTVANAAPAFTDETDSAVDDNTALDNDQNLVVVLRAVDEGKKEVNVGKPVTAKDGDGDVLLYAIVAHTERDDAADASSTATASTNQHEEYDIDPKTGQITTKTERGSDDDGDSDTNTVESFMVTATDPSGAVGTTIVRVTINDVNDAPELDPDEPPTGAINRDTITVVEGTTDLDADGNGGTPTYTATDADATDAGTDNNANANADPPVVAITYDVEGADAGSFDIGTDANTAGLSTALAFDDHTPDYETKKSYSVTVVVEDNETPVAGRDTIEVTVNVTNAEDAGTVSLSAREPQVDKTIVASLDDKDGSRRGESWQWYRNAATGTTDAALAELDPDTPADVCEEGSTGLCLIDGATSPAYKPVAADEGEGKGLLAARVTYRDACTRDTAADDVNDDGFVVDSGDALIDCGLDTGQSDQDDSAFMVTERDVQEEDPGNTAPKFDPDQDPNTAGDQAAASRSVPENEKNENVGEPVTVDDDDLVKFTLGGPDASSFKLDDPPMGANSVQIKTAMELDYETKSEYTVVVTATDPAGASGELTVNITVTDGPDDAAIELTMEPEFDEGETASRSVDENTAAGMPIGDAITATDKNTGDSVTYSLDEMGDMYFDIDSATGQLMTEADLDHETRDSYSVIVTAMDTVDLYDMITVTITVTDVNEAPTFDAHTVEPVMLDVDENTAAGENIGDPVMAMDEDEGDTLTYALGGDDAASFAIDPATGQLMTMAALDYETKSSYSVTVMATDSDGLYDMIAVTITVTDVNDQMPMFADDMAEFSVAENAAAGTEVGMVMATDADDDSLMYSGDSMYFDVDPETGQIVVAEGAMLDYEMEDMHMVTVTASDGEGSDSITVTITVTDMYPDCGMQGGDAANMYLNNDCEALLDAKDALGGSLNWSEDMAIADWDGVQGHPMFPSRAGDPMRVTALHLQNMELDGEIPAAIGRLDALMYLNVHSNGLSGDLSALGGLENLVRIYANNNVLDGLGDLSGATSLEILWAHQNEDEDMVGTLMGPLMADYLPASLTWISLYGTALGGAIPDLSALTSLERLYLDRANLSGEIPASLGSVTSLTHLRLKYNGLSGEIPMELNNLTNLVWVRINFAGDFTGCVPEALTDAGAGNSDAEHLGLPTCE